MNFPSKSFRELIVWQKAHQFVLSAYVFTGKFPKEEIYCLTSQFRRVAISIAANIAEGSLSECQYYCILSQDLKFGNTNDLTNLSFEVEKLLFSYCNAIQKSQ